MTSLIKPWRFPRIGGRRYFISTWKTDNAGTSNSTSITLPLVSGGTYDFYKANGDGTVDHITAYDQAEVTHDYGTAGTYTVRIWGTITGWRFNNGGDKLKITNIGRWGCLRLVNGNNYFLGCSNMQAVGLDDTLNLTGVLSMQSAFYGCAAFNPTTFRAINASGVSNTYAMFYGCSVFAPTLFLLSTDSITDMSYMFYGCAKFNTDISCFTTANVTVMTGMFFGCKIFNQSLAHFNTAKVTDMSTMLPLCTAFNQPLDHFDVSLVTTAANMLLGTTLSYQYLDAMYEAWAALSVKNSVAFHAGNSKYTKGGAAEAGKTHLADTHSWSITDGGYNQTAFVFTLGDSKTYLAGWQPALMTAMTAGEATKAFTYTNAGVSGATALSLKNSIDTTLAAQTRNHEIILINIGANDVGSPNIPAWKVNYQYIIDALHAKYPTAPMYLSKVWRRDYDVDCASLAGAVDDLIAANAGVCFAGDDEQAWLEGGDNGATMTTDGTHYSAAGNTEKTAQMVTVLGY